MIKELTTENEIDNSLVIIRNSFKTVADKFNLTPANCPTHPSFMKYEDLNSLKKPGVNFFGLFDNGIHAGFILTEKSDNDVFYIEKLSVLPGYRHNGYGTELVRHAIEFIRNMNGKKVSIGIINEDTVLKKWYCGLGFNEVATRHYDHLPFTVCFMEKKL